MKIMGISTSQFDIITYINRQRIDAIKCLCIDYYTSNLMQLKILAMINFEELIYMGDFV
jgi:hypothetical protein